MVVWKYDFDLETGNISNKQLLIDRRDSFGEPDGMVVEYVLHFNALHISRLIFTQYRW